MKSTLPICKIKIVDALRLIQTQIDRGSMLERNLEKDWDCYWNPHESWLSSAHTGWLDASERVLTAIFDNRVYVDEFNCAGDKYYPKNQNDDSAPYLHLIVREQINYLIKCRDNELDMVLESSEIPDEEKDGVRSVLHPNLVKHYQMIRDGHWDGAVTLLFQEIEHNVQNYSKSKLTSTNLMQNVFHKENGLLIDRDRDISEREGFCYIMSGTMLFYRNPTTHRKLQYDKREALRLIIFASQILYEVERNVFASQKLHIDK